MNTKIKSADGVTGVLIKTFDGRFALRVYHDESKESFTDYAIRHNDLQVTIKDSDAAFYESENQDPVLDHSPKTLGIKEKSTSKLPNN